MVDVKSRTKEKEHNYMLRRSELRLTAKSVQGAGTNTRDNRFEMGLKRNMWGGYPRVSEVDMEQTATGNGADVMWVETLSMAFLFVIIKQDSTRRSGAQWVTHRRDILEKVNDCPLLKHDDI
jgi:hypothetical protein